jgi:hypothetical protein
VPDERTAQAMDDERAAAELIADLLALTEAGLIVPVQLAGDICYVLADPDHPAE